MTAAPMLWNFVWTVLHFGACIPRVCRDPSVSLSLLSTCEKSKPDAHTAQCARQTICNNAQPVSLETNDFLEFCTLVICKNSIHKYDYERQLRMKNAHENWVTFSKTIPPIQLYQERTLFLSSCLDLKDEFLLHGPCGMTVWGSD